MGAGKKSSINLRIILSAKIIQKNKVHGKKAQIIQLFFPSAAACLDGDERNRDYHSLISSEKCEINSRLKAKKFFFTRFVCIMFFYTHNRKELRGTRKASAGLDWLNYNLRLFGGNWGIINFVCILLMVGGWVWFLMGLRAIFLRKMFGGGGQKSGLKVTSKNFHIERASTVFPRK